MKKHTFFALLLAGVLFCGTAVPAGAAVISKDELGVPGENQVYVQLPEEETESPFGSDGILEVDLDETEKEDLITLQKVAVDQFQLAVRTPEDASLKDGVLCLPKGKTLRLHAIAESLRGAEESQAEKETVPIYSGVQWSSSAPEIISVSDDGTLTAEADEGEACVTVRAGRQTEEIRVRIVQDLSKAPAAVAPADVVVQQGDDPAAMLPKTVTVAWTEADGTEKQEERAVVWDTSSLPESPAAEEQTCVVAGMAGELPVSVNVIIKPTVKKAVGISWKSLPTKTEYTVGETLQADGVLLVAYDDGSQSEIAVTADMINGFSSEKAQNEPIVLTVTAEGLTETYTIMVKEAAQDANPGNEQKPVESEDTGKEQASGQEEDGDGKEEADTVQKPEKTDVPSGTGEQSATEQTSSADGQEQKEQNISVSDVPVVYGIKSGANQTYVRKSGDNYVVSSYAEMEKFAGLYIDGQLVDPQYYTVTRGSTVVTVSDAYMRNLNYGSHEVAIVSTDGQAVTKFDVKGKTLTATAAIANKAANAGNTSSRTVTAKIASSVRTGDDTHLMVYGAEFIAAVAVFAGLLVYRKKRKDAGMENPKD